MADNFLIELTCPSCSHPINIQEQKQQAECPVCGSQLLLHEKIGDADNHQEKERTDFEQRQAQWQQDRQLITTAVVVLSIFVVIMAAFAVL